MQNMAAHSVSCYVACNSGCFSWLGVESFWLMQITDDEIPVIGSSNRNVCIGFVSTAGHSNIVRPLGD